jgi:hypothetical protein
MSSGAKRVAWASVGVALLAVLILVAVIRR